jgi:hypothetical protein
MRSSKSRQRSKTNRPRTLGNIINRVFDSSGPEGKVRGTPQQIIEKYQFLARDAQLSNDRVAAENFMQHAEHYTRMLAEATRELAAEQEQRQAYMPQPGLQNGQNGGNGNGGNQNRDYRSGQGQGDRSQQDRNQQDRGQQDRSQQERGQGERNQGDRNQGDRNQQDRNQQDRDQRSEYRSDYRDPAQEDQPGLTLVDDPGFGDSTLVETPEATRPQRPPRDEARREEPRREEPRRDEPRRENYRKPRQDDRPPQAAPKPAAAAEEPGLPGFLTAPLLSESLTEPQAEPPKPARAPRTRKPAAPKVAVKDEAAE